MLHRRIAARLQDKHDNHGVLGPDGGNHLDPLDTILQVDGAGLGRGAIIFVRLANLLARERLAPVLDVAVLDGAVAVLVGSRGRHVAGGARGVPIPCMLWEQMRTGVVVVVVVAVLGRLLRVGTTRHDGQQ